MQQADISSTTQKVAASHRPEAALLSISTDQHANQQRAENFCSVESQLREDFSLVVVSGHDRLSGVLSSLLASLLGMHYRASAHHGSPLSFLKSLPSCIT